MRIQGTGLTVQLRCGGRVLFDFENRFVCHLTLLSASGEATARGKIEHGHFKPRYWGADFRKGLREFFLMIGADYDFEELDWIVDTCQRVMGRYR